MPQERRLALLAVLALFLSVAIATPAYAHVKWFAGYSYGDPPQALGDVMTGDFYALALLSVVVIVLLVYLDAQGGIRRFESSVGAWLEGHKANSLLVMRVGMLFVLLFSWQADTVLAPELHADSTWIGWMQFLLALLLLFRRTVPLVGMEEQPALARHARNSAHPFVAQYISEMETFMQSFNDPKGIYARLPWFLEFN